ncbi:MAG: Do family serine endopeptidase [Gammaproteobacteria bacterium]|nr:Do family serine endopeptidase [Gammaproteobacteria bacterium]
MHQTSSFSRSVRVIGLSLAAVVSVGVITLPFSPLMAESASHHVASNLPEININNGFADLVKVVRPAVVNISVTEHARSRPKQQSQRGNVPPEFEEFFKRFFGESPHGSQQRQPDNGQAPQPYQRRSTAAGSGFIIDASGLVVTNHHVIEDADEIEVVFDDGTRVPAVLKGADSKTDLALLEISVDYSLPYVAFGDSEQAEVGDWVIAIGNPFGLGGTTTSGIISARGRDIRSGPLDDFIQVDASINRGNSGGPLFNTKGEVIGVNSAIYSPNGGSVGIGFAIPSSMASTVISQLTEHGTVQRGFLGVHIQSVSKEIADSLGLEKADGALVTRVVEDSPAKRAGIEAGDIILKYNDSDIVKMRDLPKLVALTESNSDVEVEVWRNGKIKLLKVVISKTDEASVAAADQNAPTSAVLGLLLSEIDEQIRMEYQLDENVDGVVISSVNPKGIGAKKGLREGDIIKRIDQVEVNSPKDVNEHLDTIAKEKKETVLLLIERGGQARFVVVPMRP